MVDEDGVGDKTMVIGLPGAATLHFGTQYAGTPLKFLFSESFIIPLTEGDITSVNVLPAVSGGTKPYAFSLSFDRSPVPDLEIDPLTGVISGKLEKGEYGIMTVTVTAKDDNGATISKSIRIAYGVALPSDDSGGGGNSNILLYVAIIAVVAIAAFVAYWFVLRPRMGKK
jgi:hypothetical protein